MSEGLRITKGGRLIRRYWHYDEEKGAGEYLEKDVTDSAPSRLFDYCTLDPDVTLRDVFLLIDTNAVVFQVILRNWCEEIVKEGLASEGEPYGEYHPDNIEYLELYWGLEKHRVWDDDKKEFSNTTFGLQGLKFPDFHGVGYELKEDILFEWGEVEWPKGHRIPWGIALSDIKTLINLPVRLRKNVTIASDVPGKYHEVVAEFDDCEYSLGHILYGIIWELSFHGGPKEKAEKGKELADISAKIKSGEIETKRFTL